MFQRATIRTKEQTLLGTMAGSVKDELVNVDSRRGPDGGLAKVDLHAMINNILFTHVSKVQFS